MEPKRPDNARPVYDTFHMGRSCMDLYSNDVGAAFVDIKSFAAYVGGSPTNMSVGCRRLGLDTALLTAFGEDPVGDFVAHFLTAEGVDIQACPRKKDHYTSLVVLGIEPPDKFPLVFYRDNCADMALEIADVQAAPIADSRVFQFAGTNLSREPSRTCHVARRRGGPQSRRGCGAGSRFQTGSMARAARLWRYDPLHPGRCGYGPGDRGRNQRRPADRPARRPIDPFTINRCKSGWRYRPPCAGHPGLRPPPGGGKAGEAGLPHPLQEPTGGRRAGLQGSGPKYPRAPGMPSALDFYTGM